VAQKAVTADNPPTKERSSSDESKADRRVKNGIELIMIEINVTAKREKPEHKIENRNQERELKRQGM